MNWISVNERTPAQDDMVLVANDLGWLGHGYFDEGEWVWCEYPDGSGWSVVREDIKYWCPVPLVGGERE